MLNNEQKQSITALVKSHIGNCKSQNEAAAVLKNVSPATLSQIVNDNWTNIAEKMWLSIAKQLGWQQGTWVVVPIRPSVELRSFLNDAANWSIVHGVIADAGSGKSQTARDFAKDVDNVFHLMCNEFWNKKQFLSEILAQMGEDSSGMNAFDMVNRIVTKMLTMPNPLLIIDEADKLNDGALHLFITLFNQLEGKCGIVMMATDHLEKRITKGIRLNRKGYKEIYSRLGGRFIHLSPVTAPHIEAIAKANGVDTALNVNRIVNESGNDIRRVKKLVITLLNKEADKAVA